LLTAEISSSSDSDAWFREFENTKEIFKNGYPARIKLAVLDTGINAEHPGICAKNWSPKKDKKMFYYDATKGPLSMNDYHEPTDAVGHGTHIAGLILETAPSVELYVIRVFTSADISPQEQADAPKVVARVSFPVLSTLDA
jgi:subtilisin family serine protease